MKLKELVEKYGEYTVPNDLIEKLEPPKPKSIWELKSCDKYFLLYADGVVTEYEWRENGYISNGYRDQGNVFLTKEEAEKDAERRAVETLLLKYGGRRQIKEHWDNWCILFSGNAINFEVECGDFLHGSIYFDTYEEAKIAVAKIGEQRIKKALFEVK